MNRHLTLLYHTLLRCPYFYIIITLQLSFATKEVPTKINNAIQDAEAVSKSITKLHMEQDQLVGDIFSHVAENTSMVNKLSQTTAQIRELEKYSQYLSCISHFEDLRYVELTADSSVLLLGC